MDAFDEEEERLARSVCAASDPDSQASTMSPKHLSTSSDPSSEQAETAYQKPPQESEHKKADERQTVKMGQGTSRPEVDDFAGLEETLAALARSAENLKSNEAEGDEEGAMLKMLAQQLQEIGLDGEDGGLDSLLGGTKGSASSGSKDADGNGSGPSDEAIDGLLDGLVGQLLSKEVMLEPMQTLHAEFPRFLAEKNESLSSADRSRYERQQALVARIIEAYEETPNDTDKVAQLMQEMQACGPPPSELAAPGFPGDGGCCIS
uniref:Peroxin 19 n=1 Tax=Strombidinopsis acuminata TaxID=141414 RepID=A0A7S3VVU4_9SPIT